MLVSPIQYPCQTAEWNSLKIFFCWMDLTFLALIQLCLQSIDYQQRLNNLKIENQLTVWPECGIMGVARCPRNQTIKVEGTINGQCKRWWWSLGTNVYMTTINHFGAESWRYTVVGLVQLIGGLCCHSLCAIHLTDARSELDLYSLFMTL